ncbi:MAG: DMT family transporter, partial [Anaerolineaceae bacterium]
VASSIFERAGKKIVPVELNLIKGILALVFIGFSLWITGEAFENISLKSALLLMTSGIIGIGVGDTAYFRSLDALGARKALLIGSVSPAVTTIIAMIFLNETLSVQAWIGIVVTIAGITWVISEQASNNNHQDRRHVVQGVLFGLIATLGQSIGAVLSRSVLSQTEVSPLQSNLLRLSAGVIFLTIWIIVSKIRIGGWTKLEKPRATAAQLVSATFLGTFLGMWSQQIAFKLTQVGIAQTLSSTSPLFILPISLLGGEKISARAVLGALVAVVGILLLFMA